MQRYTGKSLDAVLAQIAEEKQVSVDDITYHVIEEKQGFLGIGSHVTVEAYCLQDVLDFIRTYLMSLFTGFDQEVTIDMETTERGIVVSLDAENNAILIGRGGKTLQALNYLVRAAVSAQFKHRFNVILDINNYKNDRYQKLKAMAKRLGKGVQRSKVTVSLDPMPNDERKVIHQTLSDMPHIRTHSEGSGADRHLVIMYDEGK